MTIEKIQKLTPATYDRRGFDVYMTTDDGYCSCIQTCKSAEAADAAVARWRKKEAAGVEKDYKQRLIRVTNEDLATLAVERPEFQNKVTEALAGSTTSLRFCARVLIALRVGVEVVDMQASTRKS